MDEAAATAIVTGPKVANCVGYAEDLTGVSFWNAIATGSDFSVEFYAVTSIVSFAAWGSINAVGGATFGFGWTTSPISAGAPSIVVYIYDYTGTLVTTVSGSTSPLTSAALPYTGRYIIRIVLSAAVQVSDGYCTITSSGAISVNNIQALYNVGLSCPARLNC